MTRPRRALEPHPHRIWIISFTAAAIIGPMLGMLLYRMVN